MFLRAHRNQATAVGGQRSAVATVDGALKAKLASPREQGAGAPATNAEQLMASALAAAFLEALKVTAAEADQTLACDANVTVTVCVDADAEIPFISAHVDVDLPGVDRPTVLAFIASARRRCPYAHLLPGHFDIQVSVL
jgi:Ohr subfamily peroxiredoxin